MKVKNWLKTILAGIGIGISSAVPGVSGGTVAVILKVYEKIVWATSNIFKEFKKAIIILLPILLGILIGAIPTIFLMDYALEGFVFGVVCIFAGFIIGSFPQITKEVKDVKIKKSHIITLVITLLIAVILGVSSILITKFAHFSVSSLFEAPSWWFYLILIPVGVLASVALVVPGISGSLILVLIGFYGPLIDKTTDVIKECASGNWSHFGTQFGLLCCFGVGVLIGFYFISKLMNYLLNKYHDITFFGIIGFIIGSVIALFVNSEIWTSTYDKWMIGQHGYLSMGAEIGVGIALLIVCFAITYFIYEYIDKKKAAN